MTRGRVLFLDDDANVRRTVRLVLEKAGYDVVEAQNGEEAIQALHSGDNPLKVGAIVCDLVAPESGGMSGMEAIPYFRSHFQTIPIIVLTGSRDIDDVTEAFKQGIADYLAKPVVGEDLLAAIEKAIALPRDL